ncbi:hypothetical protein SCA6_020292 [Theobroma cacao]
MQIDFVSSFVKNHQLNVVRWKAQDLDCNCVLFDMIKLKHRRKSNESSKFPTDDQARVVECQWKSTERAVIAEHL